MLARVRGGSSAPTLVTLYALGALFPELPIQCLSPAPAL